MAILGENIQRQLFNGQASNWERQISLPKLLVDFRPHIVVAMGQDHRFRVTDTTPPIKASPSVNDACLERTADGFNRISGKRPSVRLPDNYSLMRALQQAGGLKLPILLKGDISREAQSNPKDGD